MVALIALASALVSLALRDPEQASLEQDGARLVALLESARAEARASGVLATFELRQADAGQTFRFVGLGRDAEWPTRWLDDQVRAEILGAKRLVLGPEPLIPAQRIALALGSSRLTLATDGLAAFAVIAPVASP